MKRQMTAPSYAQKPARDGAQELLSPLIVIPLSFARKQSGEGRLVIKYIKEADATHLDIIIN